MFQVSSLTQFVHLQLNDSSDLHIVATNLRQATVLQVEEGSKIQYNMTIYNNKEENY